MNLFANIDDAVLRRMTFRRQFVLAPRKLEEFSHWNARSIAGKWALHAHPDLGLTQVKQDSTELTLLGYFIDPDKPEHKDEDIVAGLLKDTGSIDDLVEKTHRFVGRWVIFFSCRDEVYCFTDPCGMRTLHYLEHSADGPWCFSQPEAVKDALNLVPNKEAVKDFFPSNYYLNGRESWWPGYDSPYEGVKHLPPNHYLEIRTSKLTRFWPRKKLETRTLAQAATEAADLLRGIFAGAARRFPLALPLTAGWDSRVLLAASKPFRKDIFYYTLRYNSHKQDLIDLEIPPRLQGKLGLPHRLIECPAGMARQFSEIYYGNVTQANYAHGPIVFGLFLHFPQDHVCLKGMCSEIARCFFYKNGIPEMLDATTLAILSQGATRKTAYGIRHFDRWLNAIRPIAESCSYNILDLFHWEQKVANLVATCEAECDLVYETMAPYNCRALLEILLSVPPQFRSGPDYILYREWICNLWPETLSEPINPSPLPDRLRAKAKHYKQGVKKILNRFKLLETAKRVRHRRKNI